MLQLEAGRDGWGLGRAGQGWTDFLEKGPLRQALEVDFAGNIGYFQQEKTV